MARINEAFETLIDSNKRVEYDAELAGNGHYEPVREKAPQKPVVVRLLQRLKGHRTPVYSVAFAPDTGQIVSSAFDNEILWWDEAVGRPSRRTRVEAGVISTIRAFSLDRVVAAGSGESQVTFCKLEGDRVESFKSSQEEWVGCVAISSDGGSLAAGSLHHALTVTSTTDGGSLFRRQEHADAVTAVTWSNDGRFLATGSADATIKVWDAKLGKPVGTISQLRGAVTALAFSDNGQFLAAAGVDLSIRIFRLADGELVKMMFGHTKPVESIAFHPNNWLFASASRDGTVGLWNAAKGIGNVRIEVSSRPVSCVAFSPDGTRLAAAGQDRLVRLWEVAAKESA
jgi:WD40 repeat protein